MDAIKAICISLICQKLRQILGISSLMHSLSLVVKKSSLLHSYNIVWLYRNYAQLYTSSPLEGAVRLWQRDWCLFQQSYIFRHLFLNFILFVQLLSLLGTFVLLDNLSTCHKLKQLNMLVREHQQTKVVRQLCMRL